MTGKNRHFRDLSQQVLSGVVAALCQKSHIRSNGIYLRASTNDLPLKSCSSTKIRNTSKLKSALWIKRNEIIIKLYKEAMKIMIKTDINEKIH